MLSRVEIKGFQNSFFSASCLAFTQLPTGRWWKTLETKIHKKLYVLLHRSWCCCHLLQHLIWSLVFLFFSKIRAVFEMNLTGKMFFSQISSISPRSPLSLIDGFQSDSFVSNLFMKILILKADEISLSKACRYKQHDSHIYCFSLLQIQLFHSLCLREFNLITFKI